MNRDESILILTASAGAGHTVAAEALRAEFQARHPGVTVEVVDVLTRMSGWFRRAYADGYLAVSNRMPELMGLLYERLDRGRGPLPDGLRGWIQRRSAGRLLRWLPARRPRLIVNTHFLAAELVAGLRRRGRLDCPQVTVTTDFELHRIWLQPPTEHYFTATPEGRDDLIASGIDPRRVDATGLPVRAAFRAPLDLPATRQRLGLAEVGPVVVLACGGFGVGPTAELFRELLKVPRNAYVVALTGRNPALGRRLSRIVADGHGHRARVVGYTDEMAAWMRAATLLVTKPGGLTIAEALACGTPLVLTRPIPGQEERNSDYVLEHGAAIKVNPIRVLGPRVTDLLDHPQRVAELRRRARALGRPDAATRIVRRCAELVGLPAHGCPPASLTL